MARKTTAQKREEAEEAACEALYEIDELLSTLGRLNNRSAKALTLKLEEIHYSVQCDSDFLSDDTHNLNEMDVLDAIRLYLHSHFDVDCLSDDEIEQKYR